MKPTENSKKDKATENESGTKADDSVKTTEKPKAAKPDHVAGRSGGSGS